jgi:hypothetical protein
MLREEEVEGLYTCKDSAEANGYDAGDVICGVCAE